MEDSLIVIFSMILAVILMFVFPIMDTWERQDDISYMAIYADVVDFVDSVRNTGKITPNMYNRFMQSIDATGNLYEVTMEHRKRFYKFDAYKNIYTKTIEDVLNSDKDYDDLQAGDYFYVSLKNTNKTQSTLLKEAVYASSQETFKIGVPYGGMVRTTVLEEVETKTTDDDFWAEIPTEIDDSIWELIYVNNDMTTWQKVCPNSFREVSNEGDMNKVVVNTFNGWEAIYCKIDTQAGNTYSVSFDYDILNTNLPTNYRPGGHIESTGIEFLVMNSIDTSGGYDSGSNAIKLVSLPSTVQSGTKTFDFVAQQNTTYIAVGFGQVSDGTSPSLKIGNIRIEDKGSNVN